MTKSTSTAIRALDRRARREVSKRASSLADRRIMVSVHFLLEALADPRIGRGVAELLALSHASSEGETKSKRECFVCCRPWTPTLAPLGAMVAEIIGAKDALVSLICSQCFTGRSDPALLAALRRDLGMTSFQVVSDGGTA
jgi:hypothetical protein